MHALVAINGGGMRPFALSLALLGLSAPAMAQEKGSVAIDATTTPGRHFGIGYYVTDQLSLRPSLGASFGGPYGTEFNLGTDVRWELLPYGRVSPYAAANFNYMRVPSLVQYDSTGSPLEAANPNVARYGAGLGLRARIKYGLSLIGEGRMMNSALRELTDGAFYGQQSLQKGAHFDAAVGVSYAFH
jgi:hypothetical protein